MTIVRTTKKGKRHYQVRSESGKNLGGGSTRKAAQKRLAQVEYFKHKGKKR